MKTIEMVIYAIFALVIVYLLYICFRTWSVCEFRNQISDLVSYYNEKHMPFWTYEEYEKKNAWNMVNKELASYDKMLYSFKPLKLKYWISKEWLIKLQNI